MSVVENTNTRTELEQRIAVLQQVCAEAYQLAGAVGAPEKVLDKQAPARRLHPRLMHLGPGLASIG